MKSLQRYTAILVVKLFTFKTLVEPWKTPRLTNWLNYSWSNLFGAWILERIIKLVTKDGRRFVMPYHVQMSPIFIYRNMWLRWIWRTRYEVISEIIAKSMINIVTWTIWMWLNVVPTCGGILSTVCHLPIQSYHDSLTFTSLRFVPSSWILSIFWTPPCLFIPISSVAIRHKYAADAAKETKEREEREREERLRRQKEKEKMVSSSPPVCLLPVLHM